MKVISKQTNSKMCMICGIDNQFGLKANFYNMEDGSVASIFTFKSHHRSYPGRVHGGMISALLDELAGRSIWVTDPNLLGVTVNMSVKFRNPVPYNEELIAVGKMVERRSRLFTAEAFIYGKDKKVLAQSTATYMILPAQSITPIDAYDDAYDLQVPDDVKEIDL